MADPSLVAARRIAIALGLVAVVGFGVYHWFFVAPVAAVFFEGIIWAIAAGAAIGWAYQRTMLDHGRDGVAWGAAFGLLCASTLIPSEIVGLLWGPFPEVESASDVVRLLPLAFLWLPVALVISWALNGWRRLTWPFPVAILVLHFIIGGSVATFGGRGVTFLLFAGFFGFEVVAGTLLGWLHPRTVARRPDLVADRT